MKTRQARKIAAREARRKDPFAPAFTPIINELHKSNVNHRGRRMAQAGWGKSPKAGVAWRRTQWIWGMAHHPRRLDRRSRKLTGRYLAELAEPKAPKASDGRFRRALAKLGL